MIHAIEWISNDYTDRHQMNLYMSLLYSKKKMVPIPALPFLKEATARSEKAQKIRGKQRRFKTEEIVNQLIDGFYIINLKIIVAVYWRTNYSYN